MAIGPFISVTQIPINGTAVASGSSTTSAWIPVSVAVASNIWVCQTSAGTPTLTVTADYTIFDVTTNAAGTQTVMGPTITGVASNHRADIAVGTTTTVAGWVHLDSPPEMDYPYRWVRYKIAVADADATGLWLAVCHNGL